MYNAKGKISEADLIEKHQPMVRRIVLHMRLRLPASIEFEDLIQSGTIGLLDAAKKFEPSMGIPFEQYVKRRIQGAILDELRKMEWMPRRVLREGRELQAVREHLYGTLGRKPTAQESADHMGITVEEFHKRVEESWMGFVLPLADDDGFDLLSMSDDPLEQLAENRDREGIVKAIENLPDQEKLALSLYYEHGLNLREIGAVMSLSESRIWQIHAKAVGRIRVAIAA